MTIFLLLIFQLCFGQNLVPNPSFESLSNCPPTTGYLQYATNWFNPNSASPDLFDTCVITSSGVPLNIFGFEMPFDGHAHAGIIVLDTIVWREYIEVQLSAPLIAATEYFVTFYVSLADSSKYSMDQIGAYFSSSQITQENEYPILVNPQILNNSSNPLSNKDGWTMITGNFIATGGEEYMTIGNFFSDLQSNATYVGGGVNYPKAYYYIDNVCVTTNPLSCYSPVGMLEPKKNAVLSLFPNPFSDQLSFSLADNEQTTISLYDFLGHPILQQIFSNSTTINTQQLAEGIYFYEVKNARGALQTGKVVKYAR